MFASRIAVADPRRFALAIFLRGLYAMQRHVKKHADAFDWRSYFDFKHTFRWLLHLVASTIGYFTLPELLKILTSLLGAGSPQNEYLLKWNRDPEEFDFRFIRDDNSVTLEIYQYPTDDRDSDERELVFSHQGKVREVCGAFAATFEQLYADRDTDEFEFNWRQPFPYREFEEFKKRIN